MAYWYYDSIHCFISIFNITLTLSDNITIDLFGQNSGVITVNNVVVVEEILKFITI